MNDSNDQPLREDRVAQWAARAKETEALFRTTVENMPGNLVLLDREGRILYLNPSLEAQVVRLCHRKPSELIGLYGGDVWPEPVWTPLLVHLERAVASAERQTYDLEAALANGQRTIRQWFVVPVVAADGTVQQILAMNHDITAERMRLEEAREADRRKSEFIAVLSHELRNPLAAIKTSLEVLDLDTTGAQLGWARRVLGRQVGHLVRMVDDLLEIKRITEHNIRLVRQQIDLNDIVRNAIEDGRAHLERGGVRIEAKLAGAPVLIDADPTRVAQIVANLLSNAAKFTPEGGSATATVGTAGNRATLVVSDTGVGIEASLLPKLFEPFVQADRTLERSRGGLGLGLALVKGLVALHDGDVTARSDGVNRGATFTVRFPLAARFAAGTGAPLESAPAGRRVLVIEDDEDVAHGLRIALGFDAHDVTIAHDGSEGLDKARALRPDVVLCDIGLPRMNGFAFARAVRADPDLRSSYLVALSGYAQPEDIAKARDAGFDHHLEKPTDLVALRALLAAAPHRR